MENGKLRGPRDMLWKQNAGQRFCLLAITTGWQCATWLSRVMRGEGLAGSNLSVLQPFSTFLSFFFFFVYYQYGVVPCRGL
ncbi:uncharacterized protein BP01DRAFT_132858 [Aspergillus saccharolyticus JOP 1030-1]|uniref:Uncharacterized protein n=1 Tax=Aspergillus saccharolyticus JOP 1030-1 TaxID=1450539 RepID=A0A318Z588_9EURO|nr:hypothetical protein BP01DRAFT_132858 [Aspergillus saccharolyticus JOP 1030-1]PYH42475.1 hypothetical protein BP01DRAFT_132858 [Aspergillus saccharolyticus JOP 1030-1]